MSTLRLSAWQAFLLWAVGLAASAPGALGADAPYGEPFRPQFHFTARENWHNDPNGLLCFGGEYHLFFQHNPQGREWGNMTWGHAVGRDLVHWTQLPHAIFPDRLGTIFSGSAVVDRRNTAGFQTGKDPAFVAIYTAAGGTSDASKGQPFTQCLAFSNDRGRTWVKYAGNPVIGNLGEGDRDPKVFWHAPSHRWVIPLYVGERQPAKLDAQGKPTIRNTCQFFSSPDLKHWTHTGTFAEELYECPGMVALPVDGSRTHAKWVLWGASGDYWIGSFDGNNFAAETPRLRGDYGPNFYAAQAYDDLPDHRVVLVSWMSGGKYPGMPFNQQMGFPVTLKLHATPEGPRLVKWPVKEIDSLVAVSTEESRADGASAGSYPLAMADTELLDLELTATPGSATGLALELRGNRIAWNAATQTLEAFGRKAPLPLGRLKTGEAPIRLARHSGTSPAFGVEVLRLRVLLDRTSIEVFGNGGLVALSACFVPPAGAIQNRLVVMGGNSGPVRLVERKLKSAWAQ